jgi:site-specific DNA recombinase
MIVVSGQKTIIVDIYCRNAVEDGNRLAEQEAACRKFAEEAGLTIGMVFAEIASGVSLEREQLTRLRRRYLAGEIQGVVILARERLSRSLAHYVILREEMDNHDVTLYCVEEQSDETATGRMLRAVLTFMAEVEQEKQTDPLSILMSHQAHE